MHRPCLYVLPLGLCASCIFAQESFEGAHMSILWTLPFVMVLLTVAVVPLLNKHFWEENDSKILSLWVLLFLLPFSYVFGINTAGREVLRCLIEEYIPFILLLLALYTVSGGILVWGPLRGTPKNNVVLLAIGTCLASLMGTTGAAMLTVRPLIRANATRTYRVHSLLFFIFLVANIGGGLTPIGDPPLFLGFLQGVSFLWTLEHMAAPVALNTLLLLTMFFCLDQFLYKKEILIKEHIFPPLTAGKKSGFRLYGKINLVLLVLIVTAVIVSGIWHPGSFTILGIKVAYESLLRDIALIIIIFISLIFTDKQVRNGNEFDWEPMWEVGQLFLAIFIVIIPVLSILKAGEGGAFSPLIKLVNNVHGQPINPLYFWISGGLSSFLDNAPTYFVFFNLACGDAHYLMQQAPQTLLSISMGSVFMGAITYIGNAPNLMVRSIAIQRGVKMPGFFKYISYSLLVLAPVFFIDMLIFLMH